MKYKSSTKFGAVLITQKPITLVTYNDENLFRAWLDANRAQLSAIYGEQLRRYGLRIVTRTYTAPRCSINAWDSKDKEASMSVKAKANMVGDLGGDLEWSERNMDKDWSHYSGNSPGETVVVFCDGIEVSAWEWRWENMKTKVGIGDKAKVKTRKSVGRPKSAAPSGSSSYRRNSSIDETSSEDRLLFADDLWGSSTPLRRNTSINARSISRARPPPRHLKSPVGTCSTPKRLSRYLDYDQRLSGPKKEEQHQPFITGTQIVRSPDSTRPLSIASVASSASSTKVQDLRKIHFETDPPVPPQSAAKVGLQRKVASPSLRKLS